MSDRNALKKRRRTTPSVQLTGEEIQEFLAHDDDASSSSSESDWDDVGVTDVTLFLKATSTGQPQKAALHTTPTRSGVPRSPIGKNAPALAHPSTSSKPSEKVRKDIGIDELFGSTVSNTDLADNASEMTRLFGSDSDDSEDAFGTLDALEDDDPDVSLSDPGAHIRKSLTTLDKKRKECEIERRVDLDLQTVLDLAESPSPLASTSGNSVTPAVGHRNTAVHSLPKPATSSRPSRPNEASSKTGSHSPRPSASEAWIAVPTNLRVTRPLISSELWSSRTSSRQVLSLLQYIQRQRSQAVLRMPANNRQESSSAAAADELVLVGVIGSKLVPRRSRNDRIYSVWCLSDLNEVGPGSSVHGCVKLFLFGSCHEKLWKEPEGTVVAVLSPRLMPGTVSFEEKDVSITLKSVQHLMILGQSPDYAICAATTKSGQPCFHVVNKSVCRYCDTHVKKAYFEASSSRPGFFDFNLAAMNKPKRKRYTGDVPPPTDSSVYSLSTASAFSIGVDQPKVQTTRVKLSAAKLSAAGYSLDCATGLTMGTSKSDVTNNSTAAVAGPSSSNNLTSPERKLLKALRKPTAGSLNLLQHLQSGSQQPSSQSSPPTAIRSRSVKSPAIRPPSATSTSQEKNQTKKLGTTFSEFFASIPSPKPPANSNSPSMVESDGFIDLGPRPVSASPRPAPPALSGARLRAAALVRSRGGVMAMERETKRKRLDAVLETGRASLPLLPILNKPASPTTRPIQSPAGGGTENTPPCVDEQKRLKLERLAALAKQVRQGSSHAALVGEAENVDEQIRLAALEKRDEMEQKLVNKTEETCTIVQCHTCHYRAWKARPDCRKSGHQLTYPKAMKRYFSCRNCSKRTVTFEKYPKTACMNCGESLFEKTGIIRERKGPNLPGEKLLPRGLEEKFL